MTEIEIAPPLIVAVSGLSSNTGKTTLMCDLLAGLPGWEACGKDPQGCCVSDLIRDQPLIRTGREQNYEAGKDTGRFWDTGAVNVHWVIAGEDQVEEGINEALSRVQAVGVLIEGNSFLDYVRADYAIMCARAGDNKLKTSARRTLAQANALYLSTIDDCNALEARARFDTWRAGLSNDLNLNDMPIFTRNNITRLVNCLRELLEVGCPGTEPRAVASGIKTQSVTLEKLSL